jgi:DNA-binding XRE family transcriptional regulator
MAYLVSPEKAMATTKKAVRRPSKSIHRPENQVVIEVLRTLRERTGLNQTQFAEVLGRTQSYVSAAERGAKMDTLQIRDWCHACGTDLIAWATEVEKALGGGRKPAGRKGAI